MRIRCRKLLLFIWDQFMNYWNSLSVNAHFIMVHVKLFPLSNCKFNVYFYIFMHIILPVFEKEEKKSNTTIRLTMPKRERGAEKQQPPQPDAPDVWERVGQVPGPRALVRRPLK